MQIIIRRHLFERAIVPICSLYLVWKLWCHLSRPLSFGVEIISFVVIFLGIISYLAHVYIYRVELFEEHLCIVTIFRVKKVFRSDIAKFEKTPINGFKLFDYEGKTIVWINGINFPQKFESWLKKTE